jgi:small-conductance mechanosensitive channel
MLNIAIIIAAFFVWKVCSTFNSALIHKIGNKKNIGEYRKNFVLKTLNIISIIAIFMITTTLIGVKYSEISIFLSSIFAIIGVALFAQWSILSNITASFIIFFNFPYKIGDEIKVIDTDGDISGIIVEISLFHVLIQQGEDLITYPNSLILQKAVIKKRKK